MEEALASPNIGSSWGASFVAEIEADQCEVNQYQLQIIPVRYAKNLAVVPVFLRDPCCAKDAHRMSELRDLQWNPLSKTFQQTR